MERERKELAGLSGRAVDRSFRRAAALFDTADPVHTHAREHLLERVALLRAAPRRIVDLGCATGKGTLALAGEYPEAQILALDRCPVMLDRARERLAGNARIALLAGDAERLPLADRSVELVFANLVLPWCSPPALFAEAARILTEDGVIVFATVGPDTLLEIRRAWASVDSEAHVHDFLDMHDIGDSMLRAGLRDPVVDVDRLTVTYAALGNLWRDLRAVGATNADARRRRTLTGPARWRRFEAALSQGISGDKLGVSIELVFGQAWGAVKAVDGAHEVAIPISALQPWRRGR